MRYLLLFFLVFDIAFAALIADYHMDNCNIANHNIFVDSSGHGYDASPHLVNTESSAAVGGVMCYAGDFTHISTSDATDEDDDYVKIPSAVLDGKRNFTITMWIKTSHSVASLVSAVNDYSTTNELWLYIRGGSKMWLYLQDARRRLDFGENIADGKWHFIALTRSIGFFGSSIVLYLDGAKVDSAFVFFNYSALYVRGLVLGQDQDTILGGYQKSQEFNGYMDEVKFFDTALSFSTIQTIYKNEKAQKNWDGTPRVCCCNDWIPESMFTPLQMQGGWVHIKNTYNDPTWTHVQFSKPFASKPVVFIVTDIQGDNPATARIKNVTRSGFDVTIVEPQGMDGPHIDQNVSYIAVNKGLHKIDGHIVEVGTVDTKKVQGLYARGDVGWERLKTTARFCQPAILANIQTLNNERNPVPKKPSKPWMTAAAFVGQHKDIYVALDRSETSDAKVTKPETVGYMISNADFAGSFLDATKKRIRFEIRRKVRYFEGWDNGGCRSVDYLQTYPKKPIAVGWKDSRYGDNGGWFRICEYSNQKIGFLVDEDTAHDRERWHVAEDGGIFVFSDAFVVDEINATTKPIRFALRDVFRSPSDRNISTKIVSQEFNLTLAEMDANGSYHDDFNGTVCAAIFDYASKRRLSDWNATYWRNGDEVNETRVQLGSSFASKGAFIHLYWIEDAFTTCSGGLRDSNETNSSDRFAIRPERFWLRLPSRIKAGEDFNFSAAALGSDGKPATDYNESAGASFDINISYAKPLCKAGGFTPDITRGWHFADGNYTVVTKYSDVNEFNLTIAEKSACTARFAKVDCDDKAVPGHWDSNMTAIARATRSLVISPHHFHIAVQLHDFDEAHGFTYLARDLRHSARIDMTITAQNADDATTQNYNALCYAKSGSLQLRYDPIASAVHTILHSLFVDNVERSSSATDLNDTIVLTIDRSYFSQEHNGSCKGSLHFNFDRNFTTPAEPFDFNLTQASYVDSDHVTGEVTGLSESARFYYARLLSSDLETSKESDTLDIPVLVYGAKKGEELLPGWYVMQEHNSSDGTIEQLRPKSGYGLGSADVSLQTASSLQNGIYRVTIKNSSKAPQAIIHLAIPSWLWYSYDSGKSYSFANSSDCSRHPCIRYHYLQANSEPIQSGQVSGVRFEQNISKKRHGVKVFR